MKEILNQIFEIELKTKQNSIQFLDRNLKRMLFEMENLGYFHKNPIGEKYTDQRTDIEATILGELESNMSITKVLKPIIYKKEDNGLVLVQKGIVIVEK